MKFTNCPICDKQLLDRIERGNSVFCPNGCYETEKFMGFTNHCFIAPEQQQKVKLTVYDNDKELSHKDKLIVQVVAYWKTNDRYLAEIIGTRSGD